MVIHLLNSTFFGYMFWFNSVFIIDSFLYRYSKFLTRAKIHVQ